MGLFHTKSIKLEKTESQGEVLYFIDYFKHKETDKLLETIMTEFTDQKRFLFALDTDSFYERKASAAEQKIDQLKQEFNNKKIPYKEVTLQKEGSITLLGMKIPGSKVNNHKVGITATPDQIPTFIEMFRNYNVFCYVPKEEKEAEDLFEIFEKTRGNFDELREQFDLCLYNDSYFRRVRISGNTDSIKTAGDRLQKYC